MIRTLRYSSAAAAAILAVTAVSCGREELIPEAIGPAEAGKVETPEEWHDKTRVLPYPKMSNELYVNPSPLIVPENADKGRWLQFALSRDSGFPETGTMQSDTLSWNFFNPHKALESGTWYWKYRNIAADGAEGPWSEAIPFEVSASVPQLVTPDFKAFCRNLPHEHPRLYCWLRPYIGDARASLEDHEEYGAFMNRVNMAMSADYPAILSSFSESGMQQTDSYVDYLYQAAFMTEDEDYYDKLHEILGLLLARGFSDAELFSSNFCATYIAHAHLSIYDILYGRLTDAEKTAVEDLLMRYVGTYFTSACGYQENAMFDNHFWQKNMRVQFQTVLCLWDKPDRSEAARHMLEYYYELWTARAPAGGFNRDGAWVNGTGYFEANVRTLAYMPMILSYISRYDYLQHPWYRNAGESVAYSWAPHSASAGFGDNSEEYDTPQRQRAAFADFLARELGDEMAGWYASQCRGELLKDTELRLYRLCRSGAYPDDFPSSADKMKWFKDIGEVVMHSDLQHTEHDLALSFRSSTFGSGSHTLADQNSFNLLYKGERMYYHSGYYTSFSDAHNLLSYRHTRAHNTVLVNGIGQPFSTEGYGMVLRADGGENIAYCIGDASRAYCGISDDPMWVANFRNAGVEQSEANGFGGTPLTGYRRQMLMLYPDIVLIYDELEASEAVRWDWLLHSPVKFSVDEASASLVSEFPESGSVAVADFFSGADFTFTQTDQFFSPPVPEDPERYPAQWHLTASASGLPAVKILAVVRVGDSQDDIPSVERSDDTLTCGNWQIKVSLDPDSPGYLEVRNTRNAAVYSYGSDDPLLDGAVYRRGYTGSSILYDERNNGEYQVTELVDSSPISTKTVSR